MSIRSSILYRKLAVDWTRPVQLSSSHIVDQITRPLKRENKVVSDRTRNIGRTQLLYLNEIEFIDGNDITW